MPKLPVLYCMQPLEGRWSLWPHPLSVNQKIVCMQLYHLVQAAVSIVRNLEVVRCLGAPITLHTVDRILNE